MFEKWVIRNGTASLRELKVFRKYNLFELLYFWLCEHHVEPRENIDQPASIIHLYYSKPIQIVYNTTVWCTEYHCWC